MRLLFICNEYPPTVHGGIGTFVFTLAHQLKLNGHEVHVIGFDQTVKHSKQGDEYGVNVVRFRSPFRGHWYLNWRKYDVAVQILERIYLARQVKSYCTEHNIDMVESYDWSGPLWFHPGRPLMVRMHGAHSANALYERKPSPRFLTYVERRNLLLADLLVGVSQHISKLTIKAAGLKDRHYQVIYNGVDTSIFRPLSDVMRSQAEVLFAGTVARRKGIYELFAAIPLVLDAVPSAHFTILGRLPVDHENRRALVDKLLEKVPFAKRQAVAFTDVRPYREMPKWYSRATCAVFPSLAEAYGLTCTEAMACGVPVVMTSRASGPEIVEDGVSGILNEPTDRQGLAEAIVALLEDASLRKSISANAIERVKQRFDIRKTFRENILLYERLISWKPNAI